MFNLLVDILAISGVMMTLLGLLTFMWIFIKPKKAPMDSSNRIAHMRLYWFALTKPHMFVNLYEQIGEGEEAEYFPAFWWLRMDEEDILDEIED